MNSLKIKKKIAKFATSLQGIVHSHTLSFVATIYPESVLFTHFFGLF